MKPIAHHIQYMIGRAKNFSRKPINEKLIYFEAALRLTYSRLSTRIISFRTIARGLGMPMVESPFEEEPDAHDIVNVLPRSIDTLSRFLPFECKCLVQAIAAKKMLDRRHVKCTFYLGVKKGDGDLFAAHAWVRVGEKIVTGDTQVDEYTVVSMFS